MTLQSQNKLQALWKILNTDHRELLRGRHDLMMDSADTITALINASIAVVGIVGVAANPALAALSAGAGIVQITIRWQKRFHDKPQPERTLGDCVQFASGLAYFKAVNQLLECSQLTLPENLNITDKIQQQIDQLSNTSLKDDEARKVIMGFPQSPLAKDFNEILSAQLKQFSLAESEIEIFVERVAWSTHRYTIETLDGVRDQLTVLDRFYRETWSKEIQKYDNIDAYLEEQVASKPLEKVFAEDFTFQDIYVPLQAQKLDANGQLIEESNSIDLETWAKATIQSSETLDRVLFVQAGPGRGKSVFCRMFADWVRQNWYPIWTPILIRLRDIRTFEQDFENILKAAVKADFATSDAGWLTDINTRFLFLLDGFDELLMERRTSEGLKEFLKQVGQFQEDCKHYKDYGHRVLITGRPLALQGIEYTLPANLERVEILPMNAELQQQWLDKWESLPGQDFTQEFRGFLQNENCPVRIRGSWSEVGLAQEPLLLYLLAAMHRDNKLKITDFADTRGTNTRIIIYQRAIDWVLHKQRSESLNRDLTGQKTENLRQILMEAGFCVWQSRAECTSVQFIEERLKSNNDAKALLEEAREPLKDDPLRNALATFYLQAGSQAGSVEFCHKSFGEFLSAERLKESLIDWTREGVKRQRFYIADEQLEWEIYDLLGATPLTREIVEYLIALLDSEPSEFKPIQLFERLEDFYQRWCEGEFIDSSEETLPQKKTRQLQEFAFKSGQRQADIYAGLNVMILLLELHRYVQQREMLKDKIKFYPCGQPNAEGELDDPSQLSRIINYSCCLGNANFLTLVGSYLSGADLSNADLSNADLSRADLSRANLSSTDLRGADLINANLSRANFSSADLRGVNLRGADLRGADLRGADLSRANLSHASLRGANLSSTDLIEADLSSVDLRGANLSSADLGGANLSRANLSRANFSSADLSGANLSGAHLNGANLNDRYSGDVKWDETTQWDDAFGLETAYDVPEALRRQLGLSSQE